MKIFFHSNCIWLPVYKNGNINDCSSFRPISVSPVLSEVVEHAINKILVSFMEKSIFFYQQYGNRNNRSINVATQQ